MWGPETLSLDQVHVFTLNSVQVFVRDEASTREYDNVMSGQTHHTPYRS
jgi:hypothetical protein